MAVAITRMEYNAAELRDLAVKSRDTAQSRRLLAIAMIMDGSSREDAARQAGMDRQTLRDWVHRYNEAGVAGLMSRCAPGPAPKLTAAQMQEFRALVVAGPDPALHHVVRWRCVDLRDEVARRFGVTVQERAIGKWLRKLGLTRLQPRPHHPKKDPAAEEAFKEDEARIGQQGTHAYIWAPVGARPLMARDNRHDLAYIFGAICPQRGVGAAMITPAANTEMMNLHLAEISTQVAPGAYCVLLCDRAGWHQPGGELRLPENIRLLHLPSYSPELNPMENVWDYLRQNKLCATVWDTYDDIVEACKIAWNWLIAEPSRIRSIGTRDWATVNG